VFIVIAFTVLAVSLLSLCSGAEPGEEAPHLAPEPPSLFSMEFVAFPERLEIYPTYSEVRPLMLQGLLSLENLHPEDVLVYMNASIDNGWPISLTPQQFVAPVTRSTIIEFDVYLHVPPYTFGPSDSLLAIVAEARNPSRTIATERAEVLVHIINNVHEVIDGFPDLISVYDEMRVFSGSMRLYNVLDEPQELHLCALGEWAERIHDLDFGSGVVLNGQERRRVAFSGILSDDVELGSYTVDLALWTPDGAGGRTIVLNFTVDMEVYTTRETVVDKYFEYFHYTIPITIGLLVACVLLTVRWWRRRSRGETENVI
jgi:hypothetical protein